MDLAHELQITPWTGRHHMGGFEPETQLQNVKKDPKNGPGRTSNPLCLVTSGLGGFDSLALPPSS